MNACEVDRQPPRFPTQTVRACAQWQVPVVPQGGRSGLAGGAVALAAALFRPDEITGEDVICIGSGGNVETALFQKALA